MPVADRELTGLTSMTRTGLLAELEMQPFELVGYAAAICTLAAFSMKRMVPLRVAGIAANCFFIVYGAWGLVYPALILHVILLPLNLLRLHQMLQLVRQVKAASSDNPNMDWLRPFMHKRAAKAGDVIFRKGELSSAMYYTVSGQFRLSEIDLTIASGEVIGEVGMIAPDNKRTMTFECIADGTLLEITYSQVKQLYYQNPQFGFYFLQLISQRLFRDIQRLEQAARPAAAAG
jgi:CRP/FNR family cyclic AMP-dependent transcriptional regulator